MESSNAPAKTKKLKGFTLVELIIVCALFSMILIGALSVLRPVSLLYKQNVKYESSRATSDIVSTYLEGVLKYADRMYFYEDRAATKYAEDESGEYSRFINTYFDGQAPTQPIYMMSIINDPVVDASGNVIEEGYGRVYVREIPKGTTTIEGNAFPSQLAISEGIYEEYGFKIDVQNSLPRTLTTTIDVYEKDKLVSPNATVADGDIVSLVNSASGEARYEANGVEVVKSSNMLNICYYDVDLHEPTSVPNYVLVHEKLADGADPSSATTRQEPAFYSNPNSASVDADTPVSNNYYIIFTLPDIDYYKDAAMNQLESISCTPTKINVACNTSKTLDEILEENGFTVTGKYTNENTFREIEKGVLKDGTDGWYIRNANVFDANKNKAGSVIFYVGFESETTQFTINFEEQPLVNTIKANDLVIADGSTVTKSMFSVSALRNGESSYVPISSSSFNVTRADGSDISTIPTKTPGAYPVTVTYIGDDGQAGLAPTTAYVIVTTLQSINVTTTANPVVSEGTELNEDNISAIISVVTANYQSVTLGDGSVYTPDPQIVTDKCTYTYPTGPLALGNYLIDVTYGPASQTVAFEVVEVAVNATITSFTLGQNNQWYSDGTFGIDIQTDADTSWTVTVDFGGVNVTGGWDVGEGASATFSGKVVITGTGSYSDNSINVAFQNPSEAGATTLQSCVDDYNNIIITVAAG